MARLELFPLSTWIRFFSDSGSRSLDRIQEALEHLENETYTPAKFMSDSVMMWADVTNGWWTALRQTASGPVPVVFIQMLADDQSAGERDIAVDAATGDLRMTGPVRLGAPTSSSGTKAAPGRGAEIEGRHLSVEWQTGKRHCLRVDVHRILPTEESDESAETKRSQKTGVAGTAQTDTPPFSPGLYQSLVHANGKLLAQVMILVEQKKS